MQNVQSSIIFSLMQTYQVCERERDKTNLSFFFLQVFFFNFIFCRHSKGIERKKSADRSVNEIVLCKFFCFQMGDKNTEETSSSPSPPPHSFFVRGGCKKIFLEMNRELFSHLSSICISSDNRFRSFEEFGTCFCRRRTNDN